VEDNSPSVGGDRRDKSSHLTGNEPMLEGALLQLSLEELIHKMDDRQRRLFACDCAERVLHLFEAKRPQDKRPREAIAVARRYALGEATDNELGDARVTVLGTPGVVGGYRAEGVAAMAAYYATACTYANFTRFDGGWTRNSIFRQEVSFHVADNAARYALGAATLAVPVQTVDSVEEAERNWQKRRALWYLQNRDASASDDIE
jgi:hypothetical protein